MFFSAFVILSFLPFYIAYTTIIVFTRHIGVFTYFFFTWWNGASTLIWSPFCTALNNGIKYFLNVNNKKLRLDRSEHQDWFPCMNWNLSYWHGENIGTMRFDILFQTSFNFVYSMRYRHPHFTIFISTFSGVSIFIYLPTKRENKS